MADKELIRQEIERRIKNLEFSLENNCVEKYSKLDILGNITTLESLLQFIDSLPEEPASEDLEEAAKQHSKQTFNGILIEDNIDAFKAGAEWQRQKDLEDSLKSDMTMPNKFYEKGRFDMREEMMKDVVDGEYWDGSIYLDNRPTEYKDGDKVKIIIVKEN